MPSVTQIINGTGGISPARQPAGGFINPQNLHINKIVNDGIVLNPYENITPATTGLAVDYLTRMVVIGDNPIQAFSISLEGAHMARKDNHAMKLVSNITGLDDISITNACQLCQYDSTFRAGIGLSGRKPLPDISSIVPDKATCENIRTMVKRMLAFSHKCHITDTELVFNDGYTEWMEAGDGDILTEHGLYDIKTNRKPPTDRHTLQIVCYYLLGLYSIYHEKYEQLDKLGLVNPRRNEISWISISEIPAETMMQIQRDVIRYDKNQIITFNH